MAVHFDKDRMLEVKEKHDLWWQGKLERPLVEVTLTDAYPMHRNGFVPVLSQANCHRFDYSPEQIIDAFDDYLSEQEFLGDAFPIMNFDSFGPGVLAAFCGARLDNSSGGVWFFPEKEKEISEIHVEYDPNNRWVQRIKAIYRAGLQKWDGSVIMGMPDLGGVMDVVASLRGSENLLTDLYDAPEEVSRVIQETQNAWYAAYNDFASILCEQGGYTNWSRILSSESSYIIQCDFCYMIGNPMFREFVLGTLKKDTEMLTNSIYHLDGIGELRHLEDILSLPALNAVQWVYGDGQPGGAYWKDVYTRIAASGKQQMIVGSPKDYLDVLEIIHGTPYTFHFLTSDRRDLAEQMIKAR